MRKPNYNMERKDRERSKQAKSEAKLQKRAEKRNTTAAEDGSGEVEDASGTPPATREEKA